MEHTKEPISVHNTPRNESELTVCKEQVSAPSEQTPHAFCIPAVLPPAVLCMNPNCACIHATTLQSQTPLKHDCYGKIFRDSKLITYKLLNR